MNIYEKNKLEQWQVDGFYRREILGISQSELADLSGIKQPVISAYESGRERRPSTHSAYADMGVEKWMEVLDGMQVNMLAGILNHGYVRALHNMYPDIVPLRKEWDNEQTSAEERGATE